MPNFSIFVLLIACEWKVVLQFQLLQPVSFVTPLQVLSSGRHVLFRVPIRATHVDANVQLRVAQDTLGRVALTTYGNDPGMDLHEPLG